MTEFEKKSSETQSNIKENSDKKTELLKLFEELKIDGTEFINDYYNTLSEKDKTDVYKAFNNFNQDKGNLKKILITKGFPFDKETLTDFIYESNLLKSTINNEKLKENIIIQKDIIIEQDKNLAEQNDLKAEQNNLIAKQRKDVTKLGNELRKDERYKEFFAELENKKDEEITFEDYKKVIEGNWQKILDNARRDGGDEYKRIKEKFKEFNNSGIIVLKDFDLITKIIEDPSYNEQKVYGSEYKEIILTSLNTSKYEVTKIENKKITYGDQVIDISTNPPKKFIKGENGFLLESGELNFEIDKEAKKEISETKNSLDKNSKEIELNDKKLKEIDSYLNQVKNDEKGISGLSELWGKEITFDILINLRDKYENNEQYKNTKILVVDLILDIQTGNITDENLNNSQKLIEQTLKDENKKEIESIEKIKIELLRKKEELEKSKKELEIKLDGLNKKEEARKEEYKKSIIEKDEKNRETLEFMNKIGLTFIKQDELDNILKGIKSGGTYFAGIENFNIKEINLKNQQFGNSKTTEDKTLWKKNLIKFMNKLVYGDLDPRDEKGKEISIFKESLIDPMNKEIILPITISGLLEEKELYSPNGINEFKIKENLKKQPTKTIDKPNQPGKQDNSGENKPNKESIEKQKNNRI